MSETLELKCRTWYKGVIPRRTKLEVPGWAGDSHGHSDGDKPQPWHCVPFVEGATYGLEMIYPFDSECRVSVRDGQCVFDGDFSNEPAPPGVHFPPFQQFAPGHYGFTSSLDIKAPPGHVVRLEPHPRYYIDETNTVPLCITGHIQTEWWPKIFFVVFKSPRPGDVHVFRKDEPYGQILIVPKRIQYKFTAQTDEEAGIRNTRCQRISAYARKVAKNSWTDHKGNVFDDKYKILAGLFAKGGEKAVDEHLENIANEAEDDRLKKADEAGRRIGRRFVKVKKERQEDVPPLEV